MKNHKLFIGLLAVGLAATATQAVEPVLSYEVTGNELILTYSGTLLQSTDAVNWTEVASASSPYKVTLGDKKLFFCAKGETSKNITIPLSDTVSLDMIWIEPGTFMMGSPEDESCRGDDETQHSVKLSQGFWLGKFEVTQAQYEAVMGMNPSEFQGSNLPVENVSWYDTTNFCAKLTEQMKAAGRLPAGYEFSLPTEAQWEYACRAGTTTSLNSGKNLSDDEECPEMDEVAWYSYNSNETTHPVGQKQPNAWGLYDMHGNVIEWCSDWYGDYPVSEANSIVDPIGPEAGSYRVNRGGYWDERAGEGRSACRYANSPDLRSSYRGFRVALVKKVLPLTITINDTKTYDGTPLVSSYTGVAVSGLMPGDSLTAGAATTAGSDIGTYLYPVSSKITTPFDTAKGIENYTVTYVITQKIISAPLTITINDTKTYDGNPLVSSYIVATATGLKQGDKLAAGAATTAGSDIGTYLYPVSSKITTPFDTAKGIKNYMVTYVITQKITSASETKDMTIPLSDKVNLDMIWIKPGRFIMGSPEDELGREDDEPKHQVTLTKGYWLGQYEVTQAQYEAVMETNPSYFKGSDLPVEQVSWNDAMEFCAKLTARERAAGRLPKDYKYTLPTEAQWEYACRAETTTALNSGKNLSDEYECPEMDEVGWYWYNGGLENDANGLTCTHPVGQKQPNAWGLHDMHGNVWEWCLDWYGSYPTSSVTDPVGPSTGTSRMMRGGSWYDSADACRSAFRNCYHPSDYDYYIGFRVALVENKDMTIPLSGTVSLDMIWIEPGTFIMGSPDDELGKWSGEVQHEVTLTSGYWLGKYEVTQAQYEAVMGTNPSEFKGADLPVEQVSWNDAMGFCAKLTAIERAAGRLPKDYEYTLPTEAQWEYACRAGTTTALNSGKNLSSWVECPEMDEVGWYWFNCDNMPHPVGQKLPNAWSLYDMHGNVREWCLDRYGDYPTSSVTDPKGARTGLNRVNRGGGWYDYADFCRSASRNSYDPNDNISSYGFRVALSIVQ